LFVFFLCYGLLCVCLVVCGGWVCCLWEVDVCVCVCVCACMRACKYVYAGFHCRENLFASLGILKFPIENSVSKK